MVAVINCGDISDLLDYRSTYGKRKKYTFASPRDSWQGAQPHLALLVDDENIHWLGRAQGGQIITDRDRRVEVVDIEDFEDISLIDLRQQLPRRYKDRLGWGILPPATGSAVIQALIEMHPNWKETISRLNQPKHFRISQSARGRLLNEQRDGVGLLLEIGGTGREFLRDWTPPPARASFLAGIKQRFVSEETLINHDVRRFPGLAETLGADVDWRVFEGNRRQIFVMNANTEPVENTLGVDVVYFNEAFKSFVLVQYKRLVRESNAEGESGVWYRPDHNLSTELDRMGVVDSLYGSREGDFRLFSQACWVKLCDPSAVVQDPLQLIKGMYLTRKHFVELLEVCKGPRGGVRLGYDNVPRHINNTLFVELVKEGWVGTCGTGTMELGEVVRMVLENRRALVLGVPL
jgi:hypothetical protein